MIHIFELLYTISNMCISSVMYFKDVRRGDLNKCINLKYNINKNRNKFLTHIFSLLSVIYIFERLHIKTFTVFFYSESQCFQQLLNFRMYQQYIHFAYFCNFHTVMSLQSYIYRAFSCFDFFPY